MRKNIFPLSSILSLISFCTSSLLPYPAYALAPQPYFTQERQSRAVSEALTNYIQRALQESSASDDQVPSETVADTIVRTVPVEELSDESLRVRWAHMPYSIVPGKILFHVVLGEEEHTVVYDRAARTVLLLEHSQTSPDTASSGESSEGGRLVLDPETKQTVRTALKALTTGELTEEEVEEIILAQRKTPALTWYLISRLENANQANDLEHAAQVEDLIVAVNERRNASGRWLLPRLFHSTVPADSASARYIFSRLGGKGFPSLIKSALHDGHERVRQQCLEMLASMIREDTDVPFLLVLYANAREKGQDEDRRLIERAAWQAGERGERVLNGWRVQPAQLRAATYLLSAVKGLRGTGTDTEAGGESTERPVTTDIYGKAASDMTSPDGESAEGPPAMSWGDMIRQTVAARVRFYEELIAVEEAARQEPKTTVDDLRGRISVLIEGVRNDPALQTVRRVDREFFDSLSEDLAATAETTVHRFQRFLRVRTLERELPSDEMNAIMSWIEERLGPFLRGFLPEGRDPAQMYDRELRIVLVRDIFQGAFGLSWEEIDASLERVRAVLSSAAREGDEIMSPQEISGPFDVVIWMLLNGHVGPLCSMAALSGREQEALAAVYRDILADRDLFDTFREDWRIPDVDSSLKHALVDELVGAERGERVDAIRGLFFETEPSVLREILSLVRDLQTAGFGARVRGLVVRQKEKRQGESAETITTAYEQYTGANQQTMRIVAKDTAAPLLLRVPVEYLDTVPASALQWLLTLSNAPTSSVCVELYTLDDPDAVVPAAPYVRYGIVQRAFTGERTRTNTVTLFPSPEAAAEDLLRAVQERMQTSTALQRSILVPVGVTDDALGLVRASILGMRLARIARQPHDEAFIAQTAAQYAALIASYGIEPPRFTAADVRALAVSGDINTVARILALLLGSLPAERVPAGRIERIYENAVFVLNMA